MPRLLLNIARCVAEKSRLPDSFAFVKRLETSEGRLSARPRFISIVTYILLGMNPKFQCCKSVRCCLVKVCGVNKLGVRIFGGDLMRGWMGAYRRSSVSTEQDV